MYYRELYVRKQICSNFDEAYKLFIFVWINSFASIFAIVLIKYNF